MPLDKVYPLLVNKATRKGRTREEVDEIIGWLTGYSPLQIEELLSQPTTYGDFFRNAPAPNPARKLITGSICGIRVEEIQEPLMQEIRYLDKLVDELSRRHRPLHCRTFCSRRRPGLLHRHRPRSDPRPSRTDAPAGL